MGRIKDYNKVWTSFFLLDGIFNTQDRIDQCELAIGRLNILDPPQIHNRPFLLILGTYEDRQLCRMLLNIVYQENGKTIDPAVINKCAYGPSHGALQKLAQVPDWWAKMGPPRQGVLAITYVAEEGNVKLRKRMAKTMCAWDI